jgi:glycosyltransferase involved in cell wall biosynthesis
VKNPAPKYSVIIPTFNGINYLPACVKSILDQSYEDFELIISDDHSVDGTKEYLLTLQDSRVSVIEPPESMSMTEHWEWALSHAKGEWSIFVGQDDGLQPYFFELSDRLTREAQANGLRSIMSSRALFFWKGCEYIYGDVAVSYLGQNKTKIHNSKFEALKALLGLHTYFELPQMYTTSIFHKDLLKEARFKQNGRVFSGHPQDANLAAVACSLETRYLKSYIPLGWVGSSPKSAGMAIAGNVGAANKKDQSDIESLRKTYLKKISDSGMQYHELAGAFSLNSPALYFWQALLKTPALRTDRLNAVIHSRIFRRIIFSCVLFDIRTKKENSAVKLERLKGFDELLRVNQFSMAPVQLLCNLQWLARLIFWPFSLVRRVVAKVLRLLDSASIRYECRWSDGVTIDMAEASAHIAGLTKARGWL